MARSVGEMVLEERKRVAGLPTDTGESARRPTLADVQAVAGERIRRMRTAAGLSQKDLATRAGISHGLLSEIENGIAPNLDFVGTVRMALRQEVFGKLRELLGALEEVA